MDDIRRILGQLDQPGSTGMPDSAADSLMKAGTNLHSVSPEDLEELMVFIAEYLAEFVQDFVDFSEKNTEEEEEYSSDEDYNDLY